TFAGSLTGSGSLVLTDSLEFGKNFVLSGADAFGGKVVISASTLELSSAGAAGTGAIVFADGDSTLRIDGTAMPTNVISGLTTGDLIDLANIPFTSGATAQIISGTNVLRISVNGTTYNLQLDPSANYSNVQCTVLPESAVNPGGVGTLIALTQGVL